MRLPPAAVGAHGWGAPAGDDVGAGGAMGKDEAGQRGEAATQAQRPTRPSGGEGAYGAWEGRSGNSSAGRVYRGPDRRCTEAEAPARDRRADPYLYDTRATRG